MQQGGRAERQLAAAPGQLPAGELVQLAVEGREQGFGSGRIAAVRRRDEVGNRGIHGQPAESLAATGC